MIHILVYVLAVPCPLGFMLLEILAMIMKYIYLYLSYPIFAFSIDLVCGNVAVAASAVVRESNDMLTTPPIVIPVTRYADTWHLCGKQYCI